MQSAKSLVYHSLIIVRLRIFWVNQKDLIESFQRLFVPTLLSVDRSKVVQRTELSGVDADRLLHSFLRFRIVAQFAVRCAQITVGPGIIRLYPNYLFVSMNRVG